MSENIAREQVKDVAQATLTDHLASTDWVPEEPAKPEEKEEGEVKVVSAHISLIFNMNSATSYCSIMCTAVRCLLMCVWLSSCCQDEPASVAESVRQAAEDAVMFSGFVYDENSGMYYDHNSGYYYDSVSSCAG